MPRALAHVLLLAASCGLPALGGCGESAPSGPGDVRPPPGSVAPPRILSFAASTSSVTASSTASVSSVSLSWIVEAADAVSIASDPIDWAPVGLTERGRLDTPPLTESTRFILRAESEGGVSLAEVEVTVLPAPEPPRVDRFTVFPERFEGGSTEVTLTWRATGTLELLENGAPRPDFPGREATFWDVRIEAPTRFTLIARSEGLEARADAFVRRSGRELEPNDDRGTAGLLDAEGRAEGEITAADVDWYAVEVTAGGSIRAAVRAPDGSCGFDSQVELWGPDPDRPAQIRFLTLDDDGGGGGCALIDPLVDPAALDLREGTHYLSVRGFDASETGPYALEVDVIAPECGNGLVDIGLGEQCDDGGTRTGDGCDASCRFEGLQTLRGPDTDATFAVSLGPRSAPVEVVVERPAALYGVLRDGRGDCPPGGRLALLDPERSAGGTLVVLDDGTDGACGSLPGRELEAGRYVVLASAAASLTAELDLELAERGCGDRVLDEGETCDDGNRLGGDGCSATCGLEAVATATSGLALDVELPDAAPRFVRVDVREAGASVTASVTAGGVDVQLGLHGPSFELLGQAARGRPLQKGAGYTDDLAPGGYYVSLQSVRPSTRRRALRVDVVSPRCPDGVLQREANESCDDGASVNGDGCSSACQLEISGPPLLYSRNAQSRLVDVPGQGAAYLEVASSTIARLSVRTAHPSGFTCSNPAPSILRLRVIDQNSRELASPPSSARSCPRAFNVPVGPDPVLIELSTTSLAPLSPVEVTVGMSEARCGDRWLDVNEECDDGNQTSGDGCDASCRLEIGSATAEEEPNDDFMSAQLLSALRLGASARLVGSLATHLDRDVYAFDVGRWQEAELVAETSQSGGACSSVDTRIRLYDAQGRLLADNDDTRRLGRCSSIELTGAQRVSEGRYFLEVSVGATTGMPGGYRLDVELRP